MADRLTRLSGLHGSQACLLCCVPATSALVFWSSCLSNYYVLSILLLLNIYTTDQPFFKVPRDKGISKTKSKHQNPCSECMHWPVTSWSNACSTCMHKPVSSMHRPVTSQAEACSYCMGSVVLISSWIYLYTTYFAIFAVYLFYVCGLILFEICGKNIFTCLMMFST